QTAIDSLALDRRDVDARAIVFHFDRDLSALVEGAERDAAFGRLAGDDAFCRPFETVVDAVADGVCQRILDRLDQRAIELGVLALHVETDALAALLRAVADEARQLAPGGVDRLQTRLHHPFLEEAGDGVEALRCADERRMLLVGAVLVDLVPGE